MVDLVIVASLGRIRKLRFQESLDDPTRKPHLIEGPGSSVELHVDKRGEIVSDQSGRFAHNAGPSQQGGMSIGEGHNLNKELERQATKRVAEIIAQFVADEGHPRWRLIAPGTILNSLMSDLPEPVRSKLADTESADLTKLPISELESRLLA